jgi:hypothetical protein
MRMFMKNFYIHMHISTIHIRYSAFSHDTRIYRIYIYEYAYISMNTYGHINI